jgi:LysR family transcriptional regulator of gallate degradation
MSTENDVAPASTRGAARLSRRPGRRSQPYPITLVDLEAFVVAVRHGTTAGAATELDVSATSLVRRIRKLEQRAAVILAEGLPSEVRPTELGRQLLPMAKRAVEDLQKIDAFITKHHDAELAAEARYRSR